MTYETLASDPKGAKKATVKKKNTAAAYVAAKRQHRAEIKRLKMEIKRHKVMMKKAKLDYKLSK